MHREYIAAVCVCTNSEISSDDESVLASGKVEPLWPLEIMIICKPVLILVHAHLFVDIHAYVTDVAVHNDILKEIK